MSTAVLISAATLVGFLGRWWWAFELASHFRVQYVWLLAMCASYYSMRKQLIPAALLAALALANLGLIAPLYFGGKRPQSETTLRLVSINVQSANRDHEAVLAFVATARPDFVLFLEVDSVWATKLRELSPLYPHSQTSARVDNFGMAIYSRIPWKSVDEIPLGNIGTPAIAARFNANAVEFTIIGAHPFPPMGRRGAAERNEQLAQLARLARAEKAPVILAGDLNATSWSPQFADLLAQSGLCDSRRGFGIQATWPVDFIPLRIPIDHCLISPEVRIHRRQVGGAVGSDHLPIVIDFSLDERD